MTSEIYYLRPSCVSSSTLHQAMFKLKFRPDTDRDAILKDLLLHPLGYIRIFAIVRSCGSSFFYVALLSLWVEIRGIPFHQGHILTLDIAGSLVDALRYLDSYDRAIVHPWPNCCIGQTGGGVSKYEGCRDKSIYCTLSRNTDLCNLVEATKFFFSPLGGWAKQLNVAVVIKWLCPEEGYW